MAAHQIGAALLMLKRRAPNNSKASANTHRKRGLLEVFRKPTSGQLAKLPIKSRHLEGAVSICNCPRAVASQRIADV